VPLVQALYFSYGHLVHAKLAAYYKGIPEPEQPSEKLDPFVEAEVEALVEAYKVRDPVAYMGHEVVAVEEEFAIPLRTPSGRRWSRYMFSGKIDLCTRDEYGVHWLWDHKTGGTALKRDWLSIDDQMAFYLWADWQRGRKSVGIIYNLIRKPVIKPRQGETSSEWKARLGKDIEARPEFYLQREAIVKAPKDLLAIEKGLWAIAHIIGKEPILHNPSACRILNCAYQELCLNDTKLIRNTGFRKERIHFELSERVVMA